MLYAIVAIMGLGLVDSYFISFLGTTELAAIALIVPITAVINSLGLGMGMAISSLNSKLIGSNNTDSAARLITDGFYLTGLVAVIAMGLLWWQLEAIFTLIGANQTTMPAVKQYMFTWLFAGPLVMYSTVASSTLRSIGDTASSARIAIAMTVTNLVLDPILIFGFGPIPALGIQGAALATVIAVCVAFSMAAYQLAKEHFILWALPHWLEFKKHAKELLEIAIPALLANAIVPLCAAVITRLVTDFGDDAVAGYGVGTRIEALSMLLVYALSSTLPMFIGQNLGAGRLDRVYEATVKVFKFIFFLQLGVYIALIVAAPLIASLFSDQQAVQNSIIWYLRIVPISYGLSGMVILVNVAVNVLGKPKLALYINLMRLCLLYFPLAWLGGQLFGLNGLFGGVAIANLIAWMVAIYLLRKTFGELDIKAASVTG